MIKINYESDFKLTEKAEDGFANVPFRFTYSSNSGTYTASYDGEKYTNCKPNEDGSMTVIFNNHGLGVGKLKVRREFFIPDGDFPDGVYNAVSNDTTDIMLVEGKTDGYNVEEDFQPPYIGGGTIVAVEVVDNLDSDDADKALSARQGKVLKGMIPTDYITEIPDNSITTAKMVDKAVTMAKLAADVQEAISNAGGGMTEIPDGGVTTAKIANGAVTNAKVATGAIKLANLADEVKAQLGVNTPEGAVAANAIYYDNSASKTIATNVQGAIDEIKGTIPNAPAHLYQDELLSADISTWTAGLLEPNGTILNGFNGHTSDFIEVKGGVDIIEHRGNNNYDTKRPTVLGYRADKSVYGILLAGITGSQKIKDPLYAEYAYIPLDVKYVRVSSNGDEGTFSFRRVGIGHIVDGHLEDKENGNQWNPYLNGINHGNGSSNWNGGGIDFIPVYDGMTIYCTAKGFSNAGSIGLYRSDKTYIEDLQEFYDAQGFEKFTMIHTFTKKDIDRGVAYIKATFTPVFWTPNKDMPRIENFMFVLDKYGVVNPMPIQLISQLMVSGVIARNNYIRNVESYSTHIELKRYQSVTIDGNIATFTGKAAAIGFFYSTYSTTVGSIPIIKDDQMRFMPKGFSRVYFVKLRLIDLGDNQSASISYHGKGQAPYQDNIHVGDEVVVILAESTNGHFTTTYIEPVTANNYSQWEILDVRTFLMHDDLFAKEIITNSSKALYDNSFFGRNLYRIYDRIGKWDMLSDISFADYALEAKSVTSLVPDEYHKGKTYVAYGTSITAGTEGGYAGYIANTFGMNLLNLGVSGSVPHGDNGSLRDERLAMMPDDTMLVTICYGANGWVTTDDINSADTSNSIGAINHAIDYIIEHFPSATICLGLDYGGKNSQQNKDIMAIAENKCVSYAHTYKVDEPGGVRKSPASYDNLHLNRLGNYRMAACFIEEIKKSILIGGQ